jgi:conjugative relaxase-like TrwC/TraI family protein
MLSIAKLRVGQEAYHLSGVAQSLDDYYTGAGEAAGVWVGGGARRLGLSGDVDAESLRAVLAGIAPGTGGLGPDGLPIRPSARRVPGFDLTFKLPKSASVLYAVSDDPRVQGAIIEAGESAVREALGWLEREAVRARRGTNNEAFLSRLRAVDAQAGRQAAARRITTSGVIGAAFRHRTSRAGDPLLHWHVLVANLVEGNDGRWSAFAHPDVYRAARTAGEIFQSVVRRELTASLGVDWVPGRHVREIAGIPSQLLDSFSKRRAEIEAWLTAHGHADNPAAAQEATLATRRGKPELEGERLDARWKREAISHGWGPAQAAHLLSGLQPGRVDAGLDGVWRLAVTVFDNPDSDAVTSIEQVVEVEEWITAVLRQVTQTSTTFTRFDLTEAVAARIGDGATVTTIDRVVARVIASPQTIAVHEPDAPSPRGRTRYTSRDILNVEARLLDTLTTTNTHTPLDPARAEQSIAQRPTIGTDQAEAVRTICAATGPVAVLVGPAGTGKTFTLDTIRDAYQQAGHRVIGAAPSARAAIELATGANLPSRTLHSLIASWERGIDPPNASTLLVIDEAGMADVRILERVTSHIHSTGGRVILVGDHHQLPEIDAGGGFEAAAQRTATVAELTINRRQHEPWEQVALAELRAGSIPAAVRAYLDHERVIVAGERTDMIDTAVDAWARSRAAGVNVVLLAGTNELVDVLNDAARRTLIDTGELDAEPDGYYNHRPYRLGERVVLRRNSTLAHSLDQQQVAISNGQTGTITGICDTTLTILRDHDHQHITIGADYLAAGGRVDHAYAFTTTRAQGGTWDQAIAVGLDGLYREAAYVDFSRGRAANLIVLTQTDLDHVDDLARDALDRHGRHAIPLPSEQPGDINDEMIDTLQQSRAKHLAHTIDPDLAAVDQLTRTRTLIELETRHAYCRRIEQLATDQIGIHPEHLRAAVQRADHTGHHAYIGATVKAFDRHNIGTIIGLDDTHGHALIGFESTTGHTTERILPWTQLTLCDPHPPRRALPAAAQWHLDQLHHALDDTLAEWADTLAAHDVDIGEAARCRAAARRVIEQATNTLIADQPDWLTTLIGYQPDDPIGIQTWASAVRDIATWQHHHPNPAGTIGDHHAHWGNLSARLLATRAWLDRHDRPHVLWPHRRSHNELVARRHELDEILATAPTDQQPLIDRLRRHDPQLIDTLADSLEQALDTQTIRRHWILEHWPHIIEYAEVTQTIEHRLWGPDTHTILTNTPAEHGTPLADAITSREPWLRHAINQLAPQWATNLDDSTVNYLHAIANYRQRWNITSNPPLGAIPTNPQQAAEHDQLLARFQPPDTQHSLLDQPGHHIEL